MKVFVYVLFLHKSSRFCKFTACMSRIMSALITLPHLCAIKEDVQIPCSQLILSIYINMGTHIQTFADTLTNKKQLLYFNRHVINTCFKKLDCKCLILKCYKEVLGHCTLSHCCTTNACNAIQRLS